MKYIKPIAIMLFFLMLLLSLRLFWNELHAVPDHPRAVQGVIDLRGWDFESSHTITLDGEWAFYPNQLLTNEEINSETTAAAASIQVPGNWGNPSGKRDDKAIGYGTYRLRILVDGGLDQPYVFWFHRIESSSLVEINGIKEKPFGIPAEEEKNYMPRVKSYTASYLDRDGDVRELDLLIQAANYTHPSQGGILSPIRFGSQAAVDSERWYSIGFQFVVFTILLLHALYALILFVFSRGQSVFLVFFLLLLAAGLIVVSDHDRLLLQWLPLNYTWGLKIRLLSYMWLSFWVLQLSRMFSGQSGRSKWFNAYAAAHIGYTLFIISASAKLVYYSYDGHMFLLFYVMPFAGFLIVLGRMVLRNQQDVFLLLFSAASILSSALAGMFNSRQAYGNEFYPIDILAAIVGFSAYWFKRYFRNAAERDALNARLVETDRLKDQFLANTSHELRTPLHGIMNIALGLAGNETERLGSGGKKDLNLLITISRRMSSILDDLLDSARLREKGIELNREPVFLQAVAQGVIDMLRYMLEGRSVRMEMRIAEDAPPVWADEKRMVQILYNLLHNAAKFTERGIIAVSADVMDEWLIVRVTDTGQGMDEAVLARVFKPYEQGVEGARDGRGIGLGLSISKELAELHGSELMVSSKPGQGSEFSLLLPLADTASRQAPQKTALVEQEQEIDSLAAYAADPIHSVHSAFHLDASSSDLWDSIPLLHGSKARILAVDDDRVNLTVLETILSRTAYELHTTATVKEMLDLLDREAWDLLIVDVMMPGMSGYELTKRVRERFSLSDLPILLLTARSQLQDIYMGFSSGANDYVTKPVDALELQYRIWSLTTLKQSVDDGLRMEAAYLQAQIQPHFLFNAMNAILALSSLDTERMHKLGDAFTTYLRISYHFLNAGKQVMLHHELELVQAYLYIEQERFEDRLSVVWEGDQALQVLIPPLTIQPIVENAVKHGILSRQIGGTVYIRTERKNEEVLIEVRDNGPGMSEETIRLLLEHPGHPEKQSEGIGLYNTNRRLKQTYGRGLSIWSRLGEGSTISFVIPFRQLINEAPLHPVAEQE
ncbi:ATP-binding protein [Paenibacillus sp. HB172176]|uniref:ATP-binding response regulator n=1 Tax=Paenibacillus sp. HB172176 TaxID=2493690 RepID=UPI00143AEDF6|nr:ATP-binding protein [Paenibacillus sp. HB172176]